MVADKMGGDCGGVEVVRVRTFRHDMYICFDSFAPARLCKYTSPRKQRTVLPLGPSVGGK